MSPPGPRSGGTRHFGGLAAEEITARAYLARGADLLARRYRTAEGEIDLVVREGTTLVFVEVKARRRAGPDSPVSSRQWARIAGAAAAWLAAHPEAAGACRFDAALIDATGACEIVEDAHRPGLD